MLTLAAPAPVNGRLLARQLTEGGLPTDVVIESGRLLLSALTEPQREAAQAIVDAHSATAQLLLDRAAVEHGNESSIRDRATVALADNRAFLAIASPTAAQNAAQVKSLTRQVNGLIRLALHRFDGSD